MDQNLQKELKKAAEAKANTAAERLALVVETERQALKVARQAQQAADTARTAAALERYSRGRNLS